MTAVAFILGFALRFLMWVSGKSLWGDEWFSLDIARLSFKQTFFASLNDVHPPLYFLLLNVSTWLFGTSEMSLRFISFSASLGLLVVLYFLARDVIGRSAAILTAFLAALSPYLLQSANERGVIAY